MYGGAIMAYHKLLKSKFLIFIPLLVALIIVAACGGDATPTSQPTDTPAQPTAIPQATATSAPAATATPLAVGVPTQVPQPTRGIVALPTPTATPEVSISAGKQGGVLNMQHYGTPRGWSSWKQAFSAASITAPVHTKLIEYNPETADPVDIRGDLATSWELASDSMSYTFKLAENAKWHDGMPLTAEDVKFSLNAMIDPDRCRPGVGTCQLDTFYKDSEVIDDFTIKVNMEYPAVPFLAYLALTFVHIFPKHHLEPGVDEDLLENLLGSGPFTLKEYKKDISMEYVRNPDYWKEGLPYLDAIKYFIVKQGAASFAAYKTGQTRMSTSMVSVMPNADAIQLGVETVGQGKVYWDGPASVVQIKLNTEREPWSDFRVRKALHLGTHRQPMIELLTGGQATLGYPLPPGFWFAPTEEEVAQLPGFRELNGEKHPDDLAEAKRLMAEAGFPDGFKSTIMSHSLLGVKEVAEVIADQWRRFLNVDLTIDNTEVNIYIQRRDSGDYEAHSSSSGLVIHDPEDMFTQQYRTDASYRRISRSSPPPRIDELYALQTREFDREKRKALSIEAADLILEETPWVPIYWVIRFMYADDRVQNFHINPSAYAQIYKWEHIWCDPECS
jgi:peptide/nickel transport system substrate-binding protein